MRDMLIDKFGPRFPEDCVNSKVISAKLMSRLTTKPVDDDVVDFYLDGIAKQFNVDTKAGVVPDSNPEDSFKTDPSKCELSTMREGVENEMFNFGVLTRNTVGAIKDGNDNVEAYIAGPENLKIIGEVVNKHDGTYDVFFKPPLAGKYLVAVYVNKTQIGIGEIFVKEGMNVDPSKCTVEGSGISQGYVNELCQFTIFARDGRGNVVTKSGLPFAAYIAGPNDVKIIGNVNDQGNGQYNVSYTPPIAGNYAIAVYLNTTQIQNQFNLVIMERQPVQPVQPVQPIQPIQPVQQIQQPIQSEPFVPKTGKIIGKPGEPFIVDIGSCYLKYGFESGETPELITPSVIGKMMAMAQSHFGQQNVFIGEDALSKRGVLKLSYPLQEDQIDFNGLGELMRDVYDYAIGHPVIIVQPSIVSLQMKINLCEKLFDKGIEAIRFVDESLAAVNLYNKPDCVIVSIGGMNTYVMPVLKGQLYPNLVQKLPFGGIKCTQVLISTLSKEGISLGSTSSEKEIARQIKESVGFIKVDENQEVEPTKYDLPDGNSITLKKVRYECFEPLFNPQLVMMNTPGLSVMIANALQCMNGQTNEVVLIGGGSFAPGIKERIENDIRKGLNFKVNVNLSNDRRFAAWKGAKLLNKMNIGNVITLQQWKEKGALILDD